LYYSIMLELDHAQDCGEGGDDFLQALPSRPGVLLVEIAASGAEPYLARTADIRRAAERLLNAPEPSSRRLNLRNVASRLL
jgi:hypothetical protein